MHRPALSDQSFLAHVFSPKKNAQPTGLRKSTLDSVKGRKVSRLHAYNRMTSVKQEILRRTGMREAYLRGETTFVEARRQLRLTAVNIGVVKPLRPRSHRPAIAKVTPSRRYRLDAMIALHIGNTALAAGRPVNWNTIDREINWLDRPEPAMTQWNYGQVKYAGRVGSEYERLDNVGVRHNPFWYH